MAKHIPLFNGISIVEEEIATIKDYQERFEFYSKYTFDQLLTIVLIERMALAVILRNYQFNVIQLRKTQSPDLSKILNAIIKFEPRTDIKILVFEKIGVNYLEFINIIEDRELQIKLVEDYCNSALNPAMK